jgi:methionyl-tRNA formyltransferase
MLRSVFMGTPDFAVPSLLALRQFTQVVGVYTQPDRRVGRGQKTQSPPVKQKAIELGLRVYQPEKLTPTEEFEKLKSLQPDVILVVAYGQILKMNVLALPRLGCVNVHASLLPKWRGAGPIQWSLLAGDKETGVTTMFMAKKLDAGEILLQRKTVITEEDTTQTLHDRLAVLGAELIQPTLEGLAAKALLPSPQKESEVSYAPKLTKEMQWLDFEKSALELDRQVRALTPWPGTSVLTEEGIRLRVLEARPVLDLSGNLGEIFERSGMILLGTSEGALELKRLQWEGKNALDPENFFNALKGQGKTLPIQLQKPLGEK